MTNINFFYPQRLKGWALGLNAGGGNIGVPVIQFLLPILVGGAGAFGLVHAAKGGIHLERAAYFYAALCVLAAIGAYARMDNLSSAKSDPREQLQVLRDKNTWFMGIIYIGTFGSFMGYSSAMPLLIKLNFWVADPLPLGTGIYFAYYAFLGAGVGSVARPIGGWLADKYGGARVTLGAIGAIIVFTLCVVWTLGRLSPNPTASTAIAHHNASWFPLFLTFFLLIFASTGIGNGSAYKMIPAIFRREAELATTPGTAERDTAVLTATRRSSAALGVVGAIGALGGFLIPITFSSPWVHDPLSATKGALIAFVGYYLVCALVCWAAYLRRSPVRTAELAPV